ncbi:MAG TPA: cytidylate kinase-like family protein [Terracidiphilus sp.]|nr:cytidylate kinase-like family protein [Terracidiphilus sp.]
MTVSRQYGSGGGRIANAIAHWLGWKLLDSEIIAAIARAARVEPKVVRHFDERGESWLRRLNAEAVRGVAMAFGGPVGEGELFDAHAMAGLTRRIIEEAYEAGNCVVVGRGAQCILEHKRDVYRVFVYAPLRERICRLRARLGPGTDIAERIRDVDGRRAKYLLQNFNRSWCDLSLYDLMIRSEEDDEATARIILQAMGVEAPVPASGVCRQ